MEASGRGNSSSYFLERKSMKKSLDTGSASPPYRVLLTGKLNPSHVGEQSNPVVLLLSMLLQNLWYLVGTALGHVY